MVKIIPYNPGLKQLARKLRKNMTPGEVSFWNLVKGNEFHGFDFDRQRCIDNYIVDFYCKELTLAVEIDGVYHTYEETFVKDETRQKKLESLGVCFLRFTEFEVRNDIPNVTRVLESKIIEIIKQKADVKQPNGFDIGLLHNSQSTGRQHE